jgi:predicted solute-binding protein
MRSRRAPSRWPHSRARSRRHARGAPRHREAVIDSAFAQLPFHRGLYVDYFNRLTYVLDADARRGLERFAELTEEDRVAR